MSVARPIPHDRVAGIFLGAAVGDALGWPYEARAHRVGGNKGSGTPEFIRWTKRSGGRFQPHEELVEPGTYSDDTQLMLAVARTRLQHSNWWTHLAQVEYPFWTAYERGGGGAVLRAARLLLRGILPWEAAPPDRSTYFRAGGNGVAMRLAPHVVARWRDENFDRLASEIVADGVLTHGHPAALVGALAYGYALWLVVSRTSTLEFGELVHRLANESQSWANIPDVSDFWPTWFDATTDLDGDYIELWYATVAEFIDGLRISQRSLASGALANEEETLRDLGCFGPKNGAGTVSALAAVFLASKNAASPREGVFRAAFSIGADTDTLASMTGGLAGAIAGTQWLAAFFDRLQDSRFIIRLSEMAASSSTPASNVALKPVREAALRRLKEQLRSGVKTLELPIGGAAAVAPFDGVATKASSQSIQAWKLEIDGGQTFLVKDITSNRTNSKRDGSQSQLTLPANRRANESTQIQPSQRPTRPKERLPGTSRSANEVAGILLGVHDLSLSREFYEHLLGLPVTRNTPERVHFGDLLVLQREEVQGLKYPGLTIFISVENVRQCRDLIVDRLGISVSPISNHSGRRAFTCKDPDGYPLEVIEKR